MEYPNFILNQLERDPIVRWGCTYAEIMSSARKAAGLAIVVFIFGCVIHWVVALILAFITWSGCSFLIMTRLAAKRADKPLFYEVHLSRIRMFIKPNQRYQLARNAVLKNKKLS